MGEDKVITHVCASVPSGVDDAVGVSCAKWFIAIINNRSEKQSAEKLSKLGIESYVPLQEELRVWRNGKKVKVDRVMIPSKIFIHCTEQTRRELVNLPFIFRFMTNQAAARENSLHKPLAVVPDNEIEQLKFMLGVSDGKVMFSERFVKGEKVEVVRGPFKGLTGEILYDNDESAYRLYINIDYLGSASVEIDKSDIVPLK